MESRRSRKPNRGHAGASKSQPRFAGARYFFHANLSSWRGAARRKLGIRREILLCVIGKPHYLAKPLAKSELQAAVSVEDLKLW